MTRAVRQRPPAAGDLRPTRTRWLVVAALLALAALVRVSSMFYGFLSGEDETVALMAKHFLQGENFPVFFFARPTWAR